MEIKSIVQYVEIVTPEACMYNFTNALLKGEESNLSYEWCDAQQIYL
jgi:hypothetical protein